MGQGCSVQVLDDVSVCARPESESRHHFAVSSDRRAPSLSQPQRRVPVNPHSFVLRRTKKGVGSPSAKTGWKSKYRLIRELGHGITATVYLSEVIRDKDEGGSPGPPTGCQSTACGVSLPEVFPKQISACAPKSLEGCLAQTSRLVAVKRFKNPGTRSFQMELNALLQVGVHPNLVRMLESYEDKAEDVLVLEYCDGTTLYDLVASHYKLKQSVSEPLAISLIYQLLLALEHIAAAGIAHQDVKPENMMLYDLNVEENRGHLKLGDFGWAVSVHSTTGNKVPADGAGSLWYAPPELNPPVQGIASPSPPGAVLGRTDMWSAGVVIYVLLVGHNPFFAASKHREQEQVEAEVLRLVAQARFDTTAPTWCALPPEAREFVTSMLQAQVERRPTPMEALQHPFMAARLQKSTSKLMQRPLAFGRSQLQVDTSWEQLLSLQQLAWLAVARAVAEPEISEEVVTEATMASRSARSSFAYLTCLAQELSVAPVEVWQKSRGAFSEILNLAFCYLDVDRDGYLSPTDLCFHIGRDVPNPLPLTTDWVASWRADDEYPGLCKEDLKAILLSTAGFDDEEPLQKLDYSAAETARGEDRGFYEVEASSLGPPSSSTHKFQAAYPSL
eukprot:TRINITY_DN19236_c0_g1_i1.p1 TRINITY_DN19236_c0_g1~~TRINITY_DN19236_c0_g1_i1.p1  ORF type:complete len:616 (-),score=104.68 TRINITY_DN19236_c0_g1_i1:9-1856(-)